MSDDSQFDEAAFREANKFWQEYVPVDNNIITRDNLRIYLDDPSFLHIDLSYEDDSIYVSAVYNRDRDIDQLNRMVLQARKDFEKNKKLADRVKKRQAKEVIKREADERKTYEKLRKKYEGK